MSHPPQPDKPAQPEHATSDGASTDVPFGSNEIRLTALQWVWVTAVVLVVLAGAPRLWSQIEPLDATPDYRIPYSWSEDYWLYRQHVRQAVRDQQVVVIGDSVIWGQYVQANQTLSHFLSEQIDTRQFANGGLNGTHPLALAGLVQNYATDVRGKRVVVHCNLLWMSSPERDLQVEKQMAFNHPDLIPQFRPNIPCYRATVADRMGVVVDRSLPFRSWAKHLRVVAFGGQDLPRWTLEHPWSNPLKQIDEPPAAEEQPRPQPVSWQQRGIGQQNLPWIDLDTSLQWHAFESLIGCLTRRGDSVFVIVGPLNEHLLTAESLERYHDLVAHVDRWLSEHDVAHSVPPVLPSLEYADASHPLAAGYARLAETLAADTQFQRWLSSSR